MEIYESTGLLLQRTVTSQTSSSLELYFWTEVLAVSKQLPACLGTVRLLADAKYVDLSMSGCDEMWYGICDYMNTILREYSDIPEGCH
jgi:hypothetical protein